MKTNRNIIKITSFLLTILLIMTSANFVIPANALSMQDKVSTNEIQLLKQNLMTEMSYKDGLESKKEIENIQNFKSQILKNHLKISDYELGKSILLALGDTEEMIDNFPYDKVVEAIEYESAIQTKSFFKSPIDEEPKQITEAEFNKPSSVPNIVAYAAGSSYQDDYFSGDGYMYINTWAYSRGAANGRQRYVIRSISQWTRSPFMKENDVLAIGSSGNIDNDYDHRGNIQNYSYCNNCRTSHSVSSSISRGNSNSNLEVYSPSNFSLALKGRTFPGIKGHEMNKIVDGQKPNQFTLWYGVTAQSDISSQAAYSHKTFGISGISVSGSSGGTLSFGIGFGSKKVDYFGNSFTLRGN